MPCSMGLSSEEVLSNDVNRLNKENKYLTKLLCYAASELKHHYLLNKLEPQMADVADWLEEHDKFDKRHNSSDEELWRICESRSDLLKRVHERVITQLSALELRALHINKVYE